EDVAAVLIREHVERAVVALRDAHVGVVDDAHHHVRRPVGLVEPRADRLRALAELLVRRLVPQRACLVDADTSRHAGTASSAGSVSMNELTENTALPAPGAPYPGGGC